MKETTLFQARVEVDGKATTAKKDRYQGMTGSIIFSIVETRPDISFANSVTYQFAKNPGHPHTKVVKTILRYLKVSKDQEIIYDGQDKLIIKEYSNLD